MDTGSYSMEVGFTSAILIKGSCTDLGEEYATSSQRMWAFLKVESGKGMENTSHPQPGLMKELGKKASEKDWALGGSGPSKLILGSGRGKNSSDWEL